MPELNEDQWEYLRELYEQHLGEQAQVAEDESEYGQDDGSPYYLEQDKHLVRFDALPELRNLRRTYPALAACFLRFVVASQQLGDEDDDDEQEGVQPYANIPQQAVYWCDLVHHWAWERETAGRPPRIRSEVPRPVQLVVRVIEVVRVDISASRDAALFRALEELKSTLQTPPRGHEDPEDHDDCCERLVRALQDFQRSQGQPERKDG
jgi:hypothetical protein